jgi:hypothetical protein
MIVQAGLFLARGQGPEKHREIRTQIFRLKQCILWGLTASSYVVYD